MGKAPAFQFYPGDWRRDTQVQMASMETRGVWFEMLCCMWDAPERGKLEGSKDEICRLLGCERDVFDRSLREIERLKIADVKNCQENVKIINRRMNREEKLREYNRFAKQKERSKKPCQEKVNTPSSSSSSSSSSGIKRKPPGLPLKETIKEGSIPKVLEELETICDDLYEKKIFPKVHAWKNKMLKEKINPRALCHCLIRCGIKKPDEPWAYCNKIIKVENGNYNETDNLRTA